MAMKQMTISALVQRWPLILISFGVMWPALTGIAVALQGLNCTKSETTPQGLPPLVFEDKPTMPSDVGLVVYTSTPQCPQDHHTPC